MGVSVASYPRSPGIRFCCPVGPTALKLCKVRPLGPHLRCESECVVIVCTYEL